MLSSNCAACKDSCYAQIFQSERISTITAKRSSLVFLKGILMLETKGQSKQQAIVIVSYAMLQVPQSYSG